MFSKYEPEIPDELPEGLRGSDTIGELFKNMTNQDKPESSVSPTGIVFKLLVNPEFMETTLVCSLERPKVNSHCLGRALVGAMSRRVGCEKKGRVDQRYRCQQGSDRSEKNPSAHPQHAT